MAIINFIRDYERVAKFQLGRYVGLKGPGVVIVIPDHPQHDEGRPAGDLL